MHIHPLDLAIVVLYLVGVTALGIYFRRGQQDVRDYFLGGRHGRRGGAIALSIVATETSTLTIIGTPAIAYGGKPDISAARVRVPHRPHSHRATSVAGVFFAANISQLMR